MVFIYHQSTQHLIYKFEDAENFTLYLAHLLLAYCDGVISLEHPSLRLSIPSQILREYSIFLRFKDGFWSVRLFSRCPLSVWETLGLQDRASTRIPFAGIIHLFLMQLVIGFHSLCPCDVGSAKPPNMWSPLQFSGANWNVDSFEQLNDYKFT